jgi:hypothetical protein
MRILALAFYNTHRSQIDEAIAFSPTLISSGRHGEDGSAIASPKLFGITAGDSKSAIAPLHASSLTPIISGRHGEDVRA